MRWEPSIAPDHRQMRHGSLMAAPKRFEFIADARFKSVHLAVGIEGAAKFHIRRPNTGVVCAPLFPLERLIWEIRRRTRAVATFSTRRAHGWRYLRDSRTIEIQ